MPHRDIGSQSEKKKKKLPCCLSQAVWTTRLEFNKACRRGYLLNYWKGEPWEIYENKEKTEIVKWIVGKTKVGFITVILIKSVFQKYENVDTSKFILVWENKTNQNKTKTKNQNKNKNKKQNKKTKQNKTKQNKTKNKNKNNKTNNKNNFEFLYI